MATASLTPFRWVFMMVMSVILSIFVLGRSLCATYVIKRCSMWFLPSTFLPCRCFASIIAAWATGF